MRRDPSSVPRTGNTLVAALAILAAIAAMVVLSSESAVQALTSTARARGGIEAVGAVELVLARREQQVVELADLGDPVAFARWRQHFGTENYGVDYVGNCEVRWKVEPCYTAPRNDPEHPTEIEFIANPNPDPTWAPEAGSKQIVNDNTYLFRIAAEARYVPGSPEQVLARAQGVRYGVINKEPLFRYVIFYAQSGNKGDLEITHEDRVEIQGNVHTNGALYVGSGSLTNDYAAVSGPSAQTIIGPTAWRDLNLNGVIDDGERNLPVRVTAVDGIFRLSKQTMYGALNGFPMKSEPQGWSVAAAYDADPTHRYPRDAELGITAAGLAELQKAADRKVTVINPYRVRDGSGFITTGAGFKHLNPGQSITAAQLFNWDANRNGIPLLGVDQDSRRRNDSRDGWYAGKDSSDWKQYSGGPTAFDPTRPQGFAGYLRTNETGGRVKKLPRELSGIDDAPLRPLERQQIIYADADHDPATDQHELAAPIFAVKHPEMDRSSSQSSADYGQVVEVPGKYLGLALGDGCLARNADGSGWEVRKVLDTGLGAPQQPAKMGLAILERPVPDAAIWPGTAAIDIVPSSSPDYLPYAYGKHWRPFFRPFLPIDVSENISPGARAQTWRGIGFDAPLTDADPLPVNRNGTMRRNSYGVGGSLSVTAACREGPPRYQETMQLGEIARTPKWYNDNWRFFHLKRPQWAGIAHAGVKASYFKDASPKSESAPDALPTTALIMATWGGTTDPANYNGRALTGRPDTIPTPGLVMGRVAMPPLTAIADEVGSDASKRCRFSLRFEGFIVPRYNEVYTFTARSDDGVRLWFDGNLATPPGSWNDQPLTRFSYTTDGPLVANTPYHFVLEYYQATGGNMVGLEWASVSQAREDIPAGTTSAPAAGLYLPEDSTGFDADRFAYVQCRIDPAKLSGPPDQKVGLMLRDGNAGLSPLLSGRDSYIAILYNPQRGFFTQRRLAPAIPAVSERASWFVGSDGRFLANGIPRTVDANGMAPAALPSNGTFDQAGSQTVYSGWHRPSTLTRTSLVDLDPELVYAHDASDRLFIESEAVPVTVNTQLCDLGDGNPFIARFGYTGVVDTARKVWIPRVEAYYRRQRKVVVELTSSVAFPQFLGARVLRVFSHEATETTDQLEFSPVDASRRDDRHLNLIYTSASSIVQGLGTPGTSELKVKENWVFGATPEQIIKMNSKNWNGRSDWMLPDQAIGWFDAANNRVYPGDPALDWTTCATPAASIPPALTQWEDALPRSFALNMNMDRSYVVSDVNSYVSSYGQWSASLIPQYRPWSRTWNAPGQYFIPALTHSYRPDRWDDTPLPTSGDIDTRTLVGSPRWLDDQPNPGGSLPALGPNIFLRIEQVAPHIFSFRYYSGAKTAEALTSDDFQTLRSSTGTAVTADLGGWSSNLLAGPCVQSGSTTAATSAVFEDLSLKIAGDRSDANRDGFVDSRDWDAAGLGIGSPTARYLASQYQVFFGIYDITEDFFSYLSDQPAAACASEEWFYSPREFWSQARTWEDGTEKDAADPARRIYAGHDVITNRQLLGKTTVLTLNLGRGKLDLDRVAAGIQAEGIQGYLRCRTLSEAVRRPMSSRTVPGIAGDGILADLFNGLLYAARTNRYPWNPNRSPTHDAGVNPWSSDPLSPLPNSFSANDPDMVSLSATSMPGAAMLWQGVHKLQPYPLPVAPAFRPDDFHHGVRIRNASDLYWGYKQNRFGESKTSIVCPNAVYVQGNVNTVRHPVTVRGVAAPISKHTPLAIFGDSINLESEKFDPLSYQNAGIAVTAAGEVSGAGILADPAQAEAEDTTYVACFLTHNIPTSRERVREGQSAAFIDTMLFNENWNPSSGRKTMAFKGSLVVMDSRRYTRAFLLDANKQYGRTVFGTTVSDELGGQLRQQWAGLLGVSQWTHSAPSVYRSPIRTYTFNDDLLTAEGTPPFTPFGVTSGGVGGWVRIIE